MSLIATINPESAGDVGGQCLALLALLGGLVKCWSISRRPTTNRKCALALMFVLSALFLGACAAILIRVVEASAGVAVLMSLMGLAVVGLLVAALVVAILGLVEYSQGGGVYRQGRAQAIWALVLSGLLVSTIGIRVVSNALHLGRLVPAPGNHSPGQTLAFDDLNFRFRAPARPWISVDTATLNKDSKVAFMRRFPEAYFLIVAEKVGTGAQVTSEKIAELSKVHLQAAAPSARVTSQGPLAIGALRGVLMETDATVAMHPLHYVRWCLATNGYAYQLVGYCRAEDQQRVTPELQEMFSRFELMYPDRVASTEGFATNFTSPRYGYSVNVVNSPWHPFPSLEASAPMAEFGMSQGDSCLIVVPAWLGGEKLQSHALVSAFLATLNVAYPNENLRNHERLTEGDGDGDQFDFQRDIDGSTCRYRFKVLNRNGVGCLIAAWTMRPPADAESVLADALSRVEFLKRPAPAISAGADFTDRERQAQGYILNQAGLSHFKSGDDSQALPLFRKAAQINPNQPLYVLNALQAWRRLERPKEALDFIDALPPGGPLAPVLRAHQAHFQATGSRVDQALTNYAGLFAGGYRNDDDFAGYINLLNLQRRYDTALAEVEKYLAAEDSAALRLLQAETLRYKRDFPRAISLLKAQREKAPLNQQFANSLAETFLQAGQPSDGLEIARELVRANEDSAYAHFLKGRCEVGLKWFREAKASFESAAKLAPANKDIAAYLDHVSGLLGEGNNSLLKEPIDAVALPPALTNAPAGNVPEGYARNYGAYYTRRITAVSYEPGREYRSTDYLLARVLDSSGVAAFSSFQIPFDPLSEQVFVNEVRVSDTSGQTVSIGAISDYYVLDDPSGATASQKKVLHIPVPGLRPGCQVAVTVTRRQQGHLDEFPYLQHTFSGSVPVRESILFLRSENRGLKHVTSRELERREIPEGQYWRVADPMIARWEPMQPTASTFLPTIWVADASAHWPVLASNYLASINSRLEPDPTIGEQARSLVRGLETNEARIAAIARHVQSNLTYKAIEFGRRARIPNRPAEVDRNKYGDCKDHAVLLQQMLEAAGVPAQLALVGHHGPVVQELPSLDQFDHMIVYVPGPGSGRFVDCTDKGADAARAIPFGLAERDALILDPLNPRFETIPAYPENASTIEVRRDLRLADRSDAVVDETVTLTGVHAAYLRDLLLRIPPTSRRMVLQRQMGMMEMDVSDFRAEPIDVPNAPLLVHCSYTARKLFHPSNDRLTGLLRAGLERPYLTADPVDSRLTPFESTLPLTIHCMVSVAIPEGFRAEPPATLAPRLDSRFAVCRDTIRLDANALKLEFECRERTGKFSASDYAAYRDTLAVALTMLEREIVFKADRH